MPAAATDTTTHTRIDKFKQEHRSLDKKYRYCAIVIAPVLLLVYKCFNRITVMPDINSFCDFSVYVI